MEIPIKDNIELSDGLDKMRCRDGKVRVKPKYLNEKQFQFAERYLSTGCIRQSAIDAGYSPASSGTQGTALMKSKVVQQYLQERLAEMDNAKIADANEVMEYLTGVMRGEVKDQFDLDASLSERTKAGIELLKRIYDQNSNNDVMINIINDLPKPHGNKKKKK